MGVCHSIEAVLHFGDIKISKLINSIVDENVGTLYVPMQNRFGVQDVEGFERIESCLPYLIFWNVLALFAISLYFLLQVALVCFNQ